MSDTQSQDVEVIRDDIERTRDDMSQTIDEIQERLSPDTLKRQAQDSVQEITDQVLGEVRAKAADLTSSLTDQVNAAVHSATLAKTDQMLTQASDTARNVGSSLWERMGQNPTPIALAALGIGVAASQILRGGTEGQSAANVSPSASASSSGLADKVSGSANGAQGVAGSALDSALHGTSQALDQAQTRFDGVKESLPGMPGSVQGFLSEQPLAAGALAIGLGLVVGLGLPETQHERAAMEPVRERVKDGVSQAAGSTQGLLEQAKEAAGNLVTDAKDAASGTAAEAKSAVKDVGETAMSASKQAASERGLTR